MNSPRPLKECPACHASVFLARTGTGHAVMIDAEPDDELGNLDVWWPLDGNDYPSFYIVDPESVALPGMSVQRYHMHFATCAHRTKWTKDSRGRLRPPKIG